MNAEEFELKTGHPPQKDDLERANCLKFGIGHLYCGWCSEHDKPRFQCGCLSMTPVDRTAMTRKRAMAILDAAPLLMQIRRTSTKHIIYTRVLQQPHVKEIKQLRLTKTEAVSVIVNSDRTFNWDTKDNKVSFRQQKLRKTKHTPKP